MPVFGTQAARFNDDGVTALYQALKVRLGELGLPLKEGRLPAVNVRHSTNQTPIVPPARTRYLAEISDTVRGYKTRVRQQARLVREVQQLRETARMLEQDDPKKSGEHGARATVLKLADQRAEKVDRDAAKLIEQWPDMQKAYAGD